MLSYAQIHEDLCGSGRVANRIFFNSS